MEIFTGQERRRFWSEEQKLSILAEAFDGTRSVADVARQHDLIPQQIYTWRRQFRAKGLVAVSDKAASFLPVTIAPEVEPDLEEPSRKVRSRPARIEIRCKGGRILKITADMDHGLLQGLIRTVEEA
jgi:transposase